MSTIFGFIGCGNMGGALALALSKSNQNKGILLCDASQEKAISLAKTVNGTVVDIATVISDCDYIFLGVKPQGLENLFDTIRSLLKSRKNKPVLISMAAGISISRIAQLADCDCGIIRIMPNTPVAVGEGMILYDYNPSVSQENVNEFCASMEKAGKLDHIPESLIDAASALSGCGPAFVYLFAEALADGAVACGLPRDQANLYAAQTLLGSAQMLLQTGKHAGELKDAVCSPGGTTIQGVRALENGGFRSNAMNAVIEAYKKTLELKSK